MPDPTRQIGGTAYAYVPDDGDAIDDGYTGIRIYWATTQTATATLETTLTLVDGQKDYSYNKTDALASDWFEWCLYGATPGEGPRSERQPIGPPQSTRLLIRQGVGRRLRLMDGPYSLATATDSDTGVISELIDPDASQHRFCNRFVRCSSGTATGQTRRTRNKTNNGYIPASGTLNVNRAWSPAWAANDSLEVWRPKGDEDTSVLVDEAINRVAYRVWWEDSWYFSADADVSEYYAPALMREEGVRAIEWAADTYPTRPGWEPVGFWDWQVASGNGVLSGLRKDIFRSYFAAGDVLRVKYVRHGATLGADTAYWSVPLEWAVAEVAYEALSALRSPSGGLETVVDADRAQSALAEELAMLRTAHLPPPAGRVRLAT